MNFNSPPLLGDLSGLWLSVGLLALPGALGREPQANQKRMENPCGSLEIPHSYEQPLQLPDVAAAAMG